MLTQDESRDMHNEQVDRKRINEEIAREYSAREDAKNNQAASPSMTIEIQRSAVRELWTALLVWDRAEYSGGRERAAGFLASVVRDALVNFRDEGAGRDR